MIHYHGGPITPVQVAIALWTRRHAMVSFANPQQVAEAAEVAQSFVLDNGAFTLWQQGGGTVDVPAYVAWVDQWRKHPGFDWCLIPDVIDGSEFDNDLMFAKFMEAGGDLLGSVPVWHMHESFDRLVRLCHTYKRVALGSSGDYATPGTEAWWQRMGEAMDAICVDGVPPCKLHGLRMLDPTIFSQLPLASADSCNVARNIGIDSAWDRAPYAPRSKMTRALILADRIEHHGSAARWVRTFGHQHNMELFA